MISDNIRQADGDNPQGYYEFEKVKDLKADNRWLAECQGKCIKIISFFLAFLPQNYRYALIFMRRPIGEIIESQKVMLKNRRKSTDDMDRMEAIYRKHLREVEESINHSPCFDVMYVDYCDVVKRPFYWCRQISDFHPRHLDAEAMQEAVNSELYRNRMLHRN